MASPWHRAFHALLRAAWFSRVAVLHGERVPPAGPVLWLGHHRNGAVDGFVYHGLAPRADFLISVQLARNPFARLFFTGIGVVRGKDDGDREGNEAALARCGAVLHAGGELFVLPEGTSALGPRHLPFRAGAIHILLGALDDGVRPAVVPVGIHYERAWAFRSGVEVVVGAPIPLGDLPEGSGRARLKEVRRRVREGLEGVGVEFEDAGAQEDAERVATLLRLRRGTPRFPALRALAPAPPPRLREALRALDAEADRCGALRYHGIPLAGPGAAALLVLAIPVAAAAVANLPPLLAGAWAGRRFPDGPNVVALWRILVGIPVFLGWAGLVVAAAAATGRLPLAAAYLAATVLALACWDPARRRAVEVLNAARHPSLRAPLAAVEAAAREACP